MRTNHEVGQRYEQMASEYLRELGYEILEQNYRCRQGEVDIIAADGDCIVFCEVKYRKNLHCGYPEEAVTLEKQRKISKAAIYYLYRKNMTEQACRFDVIGIMKDKICHYKNAFFYHE